MTIHVTPSEAGEWSVTNDAGVDEVHPDRSSAIAAARDHAGAKTLDLVDPDTGEKVGEHRQDSKEQVLLHRINGDVVGELEPAPSQSDGPAQEVAIEAPETEETG